MARRSNNDLQRWLVIGLTGPIVALNVWLLSLVLTYFEHLFTVLIVAAILAFLLNYPVKFFERARIRRSGAIVLVLLIAVTIFSILTITLMPILTSQTTQLLGKLPGWLEASRLNLDLLDSWAKGRSLPIDLKGFGSRLSGQIENQIQDFAPQALGFALGTLSGFIDTIIVIVLAFYMLLYGEQVWYGLLHFVPSKYSDPFSEALRKNFHNFFLSQIVLALLMALALIPIFVVLKVPFTLVFVLMIGIAELIPFIGATLGIGLVTLLVALQDVGLAFWVAVFAILLQQVRDNIIAPKIMGDFTGLNPIWIFIALLIGLQIAGLLGVILAVPIAGTIKGTIDAIRPIQKPLAVPRTGKDLPPPID